MSRSTLFNGSVYAVTRWGTSRHSGMNVLRFLCTSDFGLALLDPPTNKSRQMVLPPKVTEYVVRGSPVARTPFGVVGTILCNECPGFRVGHEAGYLSGICEGDMSTEGRLFNKNEIFQLENP